MVRAVVATKSGDDLGLGAVGAGIDCTHFFPFFSGETAPWQIKNCFARIIRIASPFPTFVGLIGDLTNYAKRF